MSIKVNVAGFKGRMGSTAVEMVKGDDELTLAALLDPFATEKEVDGVPVFTDKADLVGFDADVWLDFNHRQTPFQMDSTYLVNLVSFTRMLMKKLKILKSS